MTHDMETLRCERCGEEKPPGGELCPRCEDLEAKDVNMIPQPQHYERVPPHGNTTR